MHVSAEIRWFWNTGRVPALADWFSDADLHGCPAGGGGVRTDFYLRDAAQAELGLKRRGGKQGTEIKGLVETVPNGCEVRPFDGSVEIWTQWTSAALALDSALVVEVEKRRWLRKFDATTGQARELALGADERVIDDSPPPERGCHVEYTEVRLGSSRWVSFGFESFGSLATVIDSLQRTATALALPHPPALENGAIASYPSWLRNAAHAVQRPT
jgi:hypothetical protein